MAANDINSESQSFGELLRSHRARSGRTQEQLAERLVVSTGTVSRWENGLRTPWVDQIANIATILELSEAQRDRLLEAAGHVLYREPAPGDERREHQGSAPPEGPENGDTPAETLGAFCPYRGLFAFREQDAPYFFGRQELIDLMLGSAQRSPLVAVIGASGSGKSSVIYAGLLPEVRNQRPQWVVADFRPGNDPFHALSTALLPLLEPQMTETERLVEAQKLAEALSQGAASLPAVVERITRKLPDAGRLLLVADQFEELYNLIPEPDTAIRFLRTLLQAVEAQKGRHTTVFTLALTLRADFLNHALAYRPFSDALQGSILNLGPMTQEELTQAIVFPAQRLGVAFEPGLAERILQDVRDEPGNLPLLEFSLTLLWEHQRNGLLTHEAYDAFGKVSGALAVYAEGVYSSMETDQQDRLRRVLLQMVRPGEGTRDTRRLATRAEIGEDEWPLAQLLADERLVVTNQGGVGQESAEVVHEALVGGWSRLQDWIESDRAFLLWLGRLRTAMNQWEANGQDEGALLRGSLLSEAEDWLARRESDLSPGERRYVQAGVDLREAQLRQERTQAKVLAQEQERRIEAQNLRIEEQARASRRQQKFIAALIVALFVAAILGSVAGWLLSLEWRGIS